MSLINPNKHYIGMDSDNQHEAVCINCGSKQRISGEASKFAIVHAICKNCHQYMDVDVRNMIEKRCHHCWAVSHFMQDEPIVSCKKCRKNYDAPVEKDNGEKQTVLFINNPLSGAITRKYL